MFILISYDIEDDRRRVKVASELEDHGVRVQLSVFECHLNAKQLRHLRLRLARLIDPSLDRVRIYPLCRKDRGGIRVDGPGNVTEDPAWWAV
ncbi:MAG: CRISPR-associated endonuclease Cas2 [Acidobacteriota bacterium]